MHVSVKTLSCELVSDFTSEKIKCAVKQVEVSQYEISYLATGHGRHQLHIKAVGEHIRGSPFAVSVKLPIQIEIRLSIQHHHYCETTMGYGD